MTVAKEAQANNRVRANVRRSIAIIVRQLQIALSALRTPLMICGAAALCYASGRLACARRLKSSKRPARNFRKAAAAIMEELVNYRTDRNSGKAALPWFLVSMCARQDAVLHGVC